MAEPMANKTQACTISTVLYQRTERITKHRVTPPAPLGAGRKPSASCPHHEKALGSPAAVANQMEYFAFIAVAEEEPQRAAKLLGAAEALRDKIQAAMTDHNASNTTSPWFDCVRCSLKRGSTRHGRRAGP